MDESGLNCLETSHIHVNTNKNLISSENLVSKSLTKLKGKFEPYIFLAPTLIFLSIFIYYPFIKTLLMSLSLTNAKGRFQEFVGIQNYIETLTSSDFINSLFITILFVLYTVIPSLIIGLFLALLADNKLKINKISNIMFSLPMAISSAAASIIWSIIFHPSIGMLNNLLGTNARWLLDQNLALKSVSFVTTWMNLGVNFIFLYAGLKNIPQEIIESASIDGAGYFKKLFKIIIPMLSPTLFFVIFMDIMHAFQSFGQINILTQGGPGNSTNVFVFSIYREAFFNGRFDTASAQSIILFVVMFAVALIQFRFEKKGVHYS